jgi:hypothetical protein
VEAMMIKNEQQYQKTKEWLQRFEHSVAEFDSNEELKAEPISLLGMNSQANSAHSVETD